MSNHNVFGLWRSSLRATAPTSRLTNSATSSPTESATAISSIRKTMVKMPRLFFYPFSWQCFYDDPLVVDGQPLFPEPHNPHLWHLNSLPPRPTRFWTKNAGPPGIFTFTRMATSSSTGHSSSSPNSATTLSNIHFSNIIFYSFSNKALPKSVR